MLSPASGLGRVIVLLAATVATASLSPSGEWGEEGVTYGQLGMDVLLSCAGALPGSKVQWHWNGENVLPGGSFAQQGQLLLPRAALSAEGLYSCHDADGLLFSSISLRLGRPPGVPSISCRAPDFENFSCSWTSSVETLLPTCYIATYRKRSQTEDEKRRARNSNMGVCVQFPGWPYSCTVSKSEFWSVYRINVTEVNPLGSNFQLLDFTMQAIIKPDPPEGLRVEPVPTAPRRLRATWEYPVTWAKESYFLLKFRLRYRPVTHSSWSVVETANLSEVITDAVVSLEHVLQVGAKDFLDAGNWSEWSAEARATPTTGLTTTLREETSAIGQPESPAEEPSLAPNPQPIDRSDPTEKVAILVSLGIFAFIVLAAVLVVAILLWTKAKKPDKEPSQKHELLSAAAATMQLKPLPKAQVL